MKVVYAPRALRDIDEILAYISERSPSGARKVAKAIQHSIEMCALTPLAGARTDEPHIFRRALGKYRYAIFYRVGSSTIEIVRVIHGARVKRLSRLPE